MGKIAVIVIFAGAVLLIVGIVTYFRRERSELNPQPGLYILFVGAIIFICGIFLGLVLLY